MSLKRRVYCRLDDNIEYLRTLKTYVQMLMDRALFMLADFVDEWVPGISPNIPNGSRSSERMTPELGGHAYIPCNGFEPSQSPLHFFSSKFKFL